MEDSSLLQDLHGADVADGEEREHDVLLRDGVVPQLPRFLPQACMPA
jgi:hypothetical protein